MPAKSKKQQGLMALALTKPKKVYKKNRKVLKMTKKQLEEFAKTRRKGLPRTTKQRKARHKRLYGTTKLPKRGTGLKEIKNMHALRRKRGL